VKLGKLACRGLEGHFGGDVTVGARKALLHYAYKLKAGRRPLEVPRFMRDQTGPGTEFELTLDRETEALLEQEARRQRTTTSRLAAHAVLVYLAELDFLGVVPRGSAPTSGRRERGTASLRSGAPRRRRWSRDLALRGVRGEKVVGRQAPVRPPGARAPPNSGAVPLPAAEAQGLDGPPHAEIVCRAHVGPPQTAGQEPLGGPPAQAADLGQSRDDGLVRRGGERREIEPPRRQLPREPHDVLRLALGET